MNHIETESVKNISFPMIQRRVMTGLKIIFIIFLVTSITFLALIQWKGDELVEKIIHKVEHQLTDSLKYDALHLEWFTYFPSAALRIDGLRLGPSIDPLIEGGHVDIVLQLYPLLKENIVINRLLISDSRVNILKHDSHWSYDVLKKQEKQGESEWNAQVSQVNLKNTILTYNDHDGNSFSIDINDAKFEGILSGKMIDADIEMQGMLMELVADNYKLPESISCELSGNYLHDLRTGIQKYNEMNLKMDGIQIEGQGSTYKEKNQEIIEAVIEWKKGSVEKLRHFIPNKKIKNWDGYVFKGDSEGQIKIAGRSSGGKIPHITCTSVVRNGSVRVPGQAEQVNDIFLEVAYDNNDPSGKSVAIVNLKKGSFGGNSLKGEVRINDLEHPILNIDLKGGLPAEILNLFSASSPLQFENGEFRIDLFKTNNLELRNFSLMRFIEKSEIELRAEKLNFIYSENDIEIENGELKLEKSGQMKISADKFSWNKARAEKVDGNFNFASDKVTYSVKGLICQGEVESKGNISDLGQRTVMDADWKMRGVEIKEVMASFENFDQTFITSDNISGKTNIWAHALIPYDDSGNILAHDVIVSSAIEIKNGELKNLKTLEDFSSYVHVQDLRDIRFNGFRNYLKIENAKVYIPVVFIQSSALNMSISGEHSFDQHIYYNMKINAGQAALTKLQKQDPNKRFKQARKSGWINLYYILYGTTSSVQYKQDQKDVLAGFEQSAALKENLRAYLVDRFGYDVYWLEPNEWEDIPEYQ